MKKTVPIFMSVFLGLVPIYANAACNTPVTLSFEGTQDPDDDEFLYDNQYQFDLTKAGYENTNHKNSGAGRGYECDQYSTGGCSRDDVLTLPAGHIFKGQKVATKTKYQCLAGYGFNDHWSVVDDGKCHTKQWGDISVGKRVDKILSKVDCSGYSLTDDSGVQFHGICREGPMFICKAITCVEGLVANKDGKCVKAAQTTQPTPAPNPNPAPAPNPTPAPTPSCRDGRTTTNGKACCDTGNLGTYNQASDTCTCKSNLDFVIENGRGYCRAKPNAPTYTCPAAQLQWAANLRISCGSNTEIESQIAMIESYCKGTGVSETAFNEYISQLMTLSAQLCNATPNAEQQLCDKIADAHMVGDECKCDDSAKELNRAQQRCVDNAATIASREQATSKANIESIAGKINTLKSGLSTSVWKNKDGNFNTSRLVSDSVAGVVLGTAGGLITSNVIKKNQIKGGFEDISCTVRGQVVAGYGDEFQVGIQ